MDPNMDLHSHLANAAWSAIKGREYKVTPEEEPNNPIIKDSSTGCWVYICQRVNQLQEVKKEKVTISGTERFGLLEPNVVRVLEDL